MKKVWMVIYLFIIVVFLWGCGGMVEPESGDLTVTSASLNTDSSWNDIINNTSAGQNLSPQLSWEAVEGAGCYAVYMIDTTAGNWLHCKAGGLAVIELPEGANPGEYIGPYPPSGTHEYTVYVFALVAEPDSYPGDFDAKNKNINKIMAELDISGGEAANLLSWGSVTGSYAAK